MGEIPHRQFLSKDGIEFVVRNAILGDAARVLAFNKRIISTAPFLLTTPEEFTLTTEQQEEWLQSIENDSNKLAILAESKGDIIGFLDFHNGHRNRIKHQGSFGMSVVEEFRGRGIGKALLTVLLEWAKNNPTIEKVCLEVFADNTAAIQLYRSVGFVDEGLKSKAIKISAQTYHDLVLMAYFTD